MMQQAIAFEPHCTKTIHALQCARGFAALLVVYFHASTIAVPNFSTEWIGQTFAERLSTRGMHLPVFGACGVDLFFVLSGYIIWTSTRPAVSRSAFYTRRVARIVPLYWLVTITTAFILLAMPSTFRTLRFSLPHLIASLAFIPWQNPAFSATAAGALTPLVVAGWTLNFEMMFYLLFGVVAPRRHHRLWTMVLTYVIFAALVVELRPWLTFLRFYDPFLIAEFLIGCLLAVIVERNWICPPRSSAALLVVALIALLFGDYVSPAISRFFYSGLPAASLVYGLAALELEGKWPRMAPLEQVGDASYSIYLTHTFALATMRLVWRPFSGELISPWFQSIFALSIVVTAVALGFASFRLLERPLSTRAEQFLGIRRPAPAGSPNEAVTTGVLALRTL